VASRFYCPAPLRVGEDFVLPRALAHHAGTVLRLRDGEPVVLFNGEGGEYHGTLHVAGRELSVSLHEYVADDRCPPLAITLVQALATGDKMDWVVQKAGELGVCAVQPIAAERSVLKLVGERADKRVQHWQEVAVSAAEQCACNRPLQVAPVSSLSAWLAKLNEGERWLLDPLDGEPLSSLSAPSSAVAIMVGPEAGWSDAELAQARAAGCRRVSMGPRVLRTETAGLAVVAAMLALWGDY